MELPKAYEPGKYEQDIYKQWEESGLFNPDVCIEKGVTKADAEPFSIVLPPPNVTGTLHMGHAAMLAIEDVMIRYHRMKGDRTLWVPGTDHAAVATESKVENKLIKEKGMKNPKKELGREKFLDEVKKFAKDSHDTIVNQSKRMGASLDWSREAYTLDEKRNLAVRTVFKKMYDDGLIYRGYRVVNWSVKGQSTCSDDELVYIDRPGKLYYFKYSKEFPITIATTRPETKLGDTAVAVNPHDKRYKKYIGKIFTVDVGAAVPLTIQIISDENVDPNFGTGALGVTPAHSIADFDIYLRNKKQNPINLVQVIGEDGKMTPTAGKNYEGLDVLEARKKFVEYLRNQKLLEKEEDITQSVGTSDRFGDVVEPLPKTQWFVDVKKEIPRLKKTLKKLMLDAVQNDGIKILPEKFERTYFSWINNLRDWNISRQIWFGHQIPVWYKGEEVYVDVEAPEGDGWQQDPDTLDTWFSSGLWTFSALGWPNEKEWEKNKVFHPTAVLETGYDIIFFWVARMILMTTYTLGEIPFKTVYLHGLVRDEQGRKMSKSLDNIIDPLEMCDKYGTDATRLSLLIGGGPGNDMKLSEEKIAGFRNFANKLWNIARFINTVIQSEAKNPSRNQTTPEPRTLADKWILGRLSTIAREVTTNIEKYNFSYAGEQLRDFTWGELADWYLEIAKIEGNKSDMLTYILNTILKLWHPYMPFVTEAIWKEIYGQDTMLMVEKWPVVIPSVAEESLEFGIIRNIITGIRTLRSENKIEPAKLLVATMSAGDKKKLLEENAEVIKKLARLEDLKIESTIEKPQSAVGFVEGGVEVYIDLGGVVDVEKEKTRLTKEIADLEKYVNAQESKLQNQDFVARAPAAVVEGEKKKLAEAREKLAKLSTQLNSLS